MACVAAQLQLPDVVRLMSGKQGSKRKSDADKVLAAFKAMAAPSEIAILKDPNSAPGLIKETIKQFFILLRHRCVESFRQNGLLGSQRHLQGHRDWLQQGARQLARQQGER